MRVDGGVLGLPSPIGTPNGTADSAGFGRYLGVDARGGGVIDAAATPLVT